MHFVKITTTNLVVQEETHHYSIYGPHGDHSIDVQVRVETDLRGPVRAVRNTWSDIAVTAGPAQGRLEACRDVEQHLKYGQIYKEEKRR